MSGLMLDHLKLLKFNSITIRARWVKRLRPGEDRMRFGDLIETVAFGGGFLHLLLLI